MNYEVIHMDGRYNSYGFVYLIQFSKSVSHGTGVLDFDRCRRWFNEHFGWSQDVETRHAMWRNQQFKPGVYEPNDINPIWAYAVKYGLYRIYVDSDKTLTWFVLNHPCG